MKYVFQLSFYTVLEYCTNKRNIYDSCTLYLNLPITIQTFAGAVVLASVSSVLFVVSSENEGKSVLYSLLEKVIASLAVSSLWVVCVDVIVVVTVVDGVIGGFCCFRSWGLLIFLLGPFAANIKYQNRFDCIILLRSLQHNIKQNKKNTQFLYLFIVFLILTTHMCSIYSYTFIRAGNILLIMSK